MWQQIFDQVMTALFLLQIIMFGFLSIKRSPSAVAVLVLIPVTILARAAVASIFREPLRAMSLRSAVDVDGVDARKLSTGGAGNAAAGGSSSLSGSTAAKAANGAVAVDPSTAAEKLYVSPAMKFDGADLAELKREAANVEQILALDEATSALDAASEAEFQRARTTKKQETLRARETRRASSAASSRRRSSSAGAGAAAPAAAAAAAAAPAAAAAATTTSTTTEDVEAAAAPFVAAATSAPAAAPAPAAAAPAPPAPVIGPPRGNGDAV